MSRVPRPLAERIAESLEPLRAPHPSEGNRVRLLATGPDYFADLLAAIDAATASVHLETYLFGDDPLGRRLLAALEDAAARGVQVRLLIDGFGGGEFARQLARRFVQGPLQVRLYRPERWWNRPRRRLLRRLHRKIAVIDGRLAYVGGINVVDEPGPDPRTGEALGPRLDFAVSCEGPVVAAIAHAVGRLWWAAGVSAWGDLTRDRPRRVPAAAPLAGGVRAALVLRDNLRHRHSIERAYRAALRTARREVVVACAYFLPGKRMRRALLDAAARGARVHLLLQGRADHRIQHFAQRSLYGQLLAGGVAISEYQASFLHAKVAVVDAHWATVGSSNIDPFSLLLAREANLVVRDADFCRDLGQRLAQASAAGAVAVDPLRYARRPPWERARDWLAYAFVRAATLVLANVRDY